MSWMKWEIISSTSSCGIFVTGDEYGLGVSRAPEKYRLILALLRYQSLLASNSTAAVALTRQNEWMKEQEMDCRITC